MKFILLLSLLFSGTSYATKVILAVENSWPPFANQYGEGISKQIIQSAFDSQNVVVEFVVVPYARALLMAENGLVDGAFNVTKQTSTIERFAFGSEPLLTTQASYYYPQDSKTNYQSAVQIPDDTSIGLIIGYEYGNLYESQRHRFKEVRVAHQEQIVQLLITKRIDMAIMFDQVASHIMTSMKLDVSEIQKGGVNHVSEIFVAFNKAQSRQALISLLDNGLKTIKASNEALKQ